MDSVFLFFHIYKLKFPLTHPIENKYLIHRRGESQLLIGCVFGSLFAIFLLALWRTMHVKDSKAHWKAATRTFIEHKSSNARILKKST